MGLERNMKQRKEVESDGKGLFFFIGPSFVIITSMMENAEIALPSDSHCITWSLKIAFKPSTCFDVRVLKNEDTCP